MKGHFWHYPLPGHRSAAGRADARDDRHHAARDHAGRHGRGGASRSGRRLATRREAELASAAGNGPGQGEGRSWKHSWRNVRQRRERDAAAAGAAARHGVATAGMVLLPLLDREIPLVADPWAKPELGSGCVKITPAHDPNDYEVGQRCDLPMINILQPGRRAQRQRRPLPGLTIQQRAPARGRRPGSRGAAGSGRGSRNRVGAFGSQQDADRAVSGRPVVREDGPRWPSRPWTR